MLLFYFYTSPKTNTFLSCLLLIIGNAYSQNCNCDYNLYPSIYGQQFDARNVLPGEVICMNAVDIDGNPGTYNQWTAFFNLNGTKEQPIIIKNCGGQVIINAITEGLQTINSNYFKITGTGDSNHFYGFQINGGTDGVRINTFSNNYELDHISVLGTINHGFDLKNDPFCNDPRAWRSSGIVNEYIIVHDTKVSQIGLEGYYIGDSHYHTTVNCIWAGDEFPIISVEEAAIERAEIYNNIVDYTGNDGMQIGSVIGEALIYDNEVRNYGQTDITGQHRSGIQTNPGTKAKIYRNKVINGPGTAFFITGDGVEIANNLAINVKTAVESYDNLTSLDSEYKIYNNTFIDVFESGIAIIAAEFTRSKNVFYNNILHGKAGIDFWPYRFFSAFSEENMQHNFLTLDYSQFNFSAPMTEDFSLTENSELLINQGNCTPFNLTNDILKNERPTSHNCDIGAFEFTPPLNNTPNNETEHPNPNNPTDTSNPINETLTIQGATTQSTPFSIYPNPTQKNKTIHITLKDNTQYESVVSLYDLNGKLINKHHSNQQSFSINYPSDLQNGMYLLKISINNLSIREEKIIFRN